MTIQLNVLHERAMEVIRYLEKVKDVEILECPDTSRQDNSMVVKKRESWIGAIEDPSQELLDYADKVRGECDHRI